MAHKAQIIAGSVKRHPDTHGVTFMVHCCGEHKKSAHIQNVHRFSLDELARIREDLLVEVAEEHEKIIAAERFLSSEQAQAGDCGCKP